MLSRRVWNFANIDGIKGILAYRGYNIHELAHIPHLKKPAICCGLANFPMPRN